MSVPLRVLSWGGRWGHALTNEVARPFEARTGTPVEVVTQVGLDVPEALHRALATGERPPFDVVWSGISVARQAAERGHTVSLAGRVAALSELRARARPEPLDGNADASAWPFVQPYVVYYVLVYANAAVATAPRTWGALLDERHRGRVALYPQGNGVFPVAQLLGGGSVAAMEMRDARTPNAGDPLAPCWTGLERLRPQVGALDYSPKLTEPLRRGDVTLAFRTLPNALGFRDDGLDVGWSAPDEGVPDTVDALWIPKGAGEAATAAASDFIAFALSPEVQDAWCASMGTMPVHPGARRPAIMDGANLPRHADDVEGSLYVSEMTKYRYRAAWESAFERIFATR